MSEVRMRVNPLISKIAMERKEEHSDGGISLVRACVQNPPKCPSRNDSIEIAVTSGIKGAGLALEIKCPVHGDLEMQNGDHKNMGIEETLTFKYIFQRTLTKLLVEPYFWAGCIVISIALFLMSVAKRPDKAQ